MTLMAVMATATATRWRPTPDQLMILEEIYRGGIKTPSAGQIQRIAAHLSLYGKIECKNVVYWFQNHKGREKQKTRRRLLILGKQRYFGAQQLQQQQQQPPSSHHHHHYPPPDLLLPSGHRHLQYPPPPPHAILGPQYNVLYLVEPAAHARYDCGLLQNSHQGRIASCGSPPQTWDNTWIRLSCTDNKAEDDDDDAASLMTHAAATTTTPPPTLDDFSSSATSTTSSAATKAQLETLRLFPTTSATGFRRPEPRQDHPTAASPLSLSLALN